MSNDSPAAIKGTLARLFKLTPDISDIFNGVE